MRETVTVHGLSGMAARLRALPREIAGRRGGPLRFALFRASKIIKEEVIRRAPRGVGTPMPGNLKKQIYLYRDRNPSSHGASERYLLSVRMKRRRVSKKMLSFGAAPARSPLNVIAGDAYYWRFVEFGTVKQPAQSFLRGGFETKKREALSTFVRELDKGITLAANKLRRMYK